MLKDGGTYEGGVNGWCRWRWYGLGRGGAVSGCCLEQQHQVMALVVQVILCIAAAATLLPGASANPDAKRLYDDLLSNYNRLIRPVGNNSDRLTVKMGLRLSQLIDIVSIFVVITYFCCVYPLDQFESSLKYGHYHR